MRAYGYLERRQTNAAAEVVIGLVHGKWALYSDVWPS